MRFKELRGLGVALLLAILDGVLIGLSLHAQDRMKLIVGPAVIFFNCDFVIHAILYSVI